MALGAGIGKEFPGPAGQPVLQRGRGPAGAVRVCLTAAGLDAVAVAALAIVLILSWASLLHADTYRWVDAEGRLHYSNAPAEIRSAEQPEQVVEEQGGGGSQEERLRPGRGTESGSGAEEDDDGDERVRRPAGGRAAAAPPLAARVSIERWTLEREYRKAKARLGAIDRKLRRFGAARQRYSRTGHEAVGGLPTSGAALVRSPEEDSLEEERAAVEKELEKIRRRHAALKQQLLTRRGGRVPAGWRDLR